MVYVVVLVVLEEFGIMYNLLFFYGGVGLGKIYLMYVIGNKLLEIDLISNIKYVISEFFMNELINVI